MSVRYRDELESLGADEPEFEQDESARAAGPGTGVPRLTGATHGPYDEDDVDPRITGAAERLDFGAVQVAVPPGGQVAVEPTNKDRLDAVHITVPGGRLSVSALAAPRSAGLWKDLCSEIEQSLRAGGATVRTEYGEWGRELHARTQNVSSVFIGVDGDRWMVYGVAAGPSGGLGELDGQLRRMLRGMVVVRGKSPYPPRTVLPLTLPPGLRADDDAAAAPRKATLTLRTRAVAAATATASDGSESSRAAVADAADAWATTVIPRVLATPHPDAAGGARPEPSRNRAAVRRARPKQPMNGLPQRAPLPQSQPMPLSDGGPGTSVLPPYRAPGHLAAAAAQPGPGATAPWPAPGRPEPAQRAAPPPQPPAPPVAAPQVAAPAPYGRPMPAAQPAQGSAVLRPVPGQQPAAESGRLLGGRRHRPTEDILGQGPVVIPDDEAPTTLYDELMAEVRAAGSGPANGSRRAAATGPAGRANLADPAARPGRASPTGQVGRLPAAGPSGATGRGRGAHRAQDGGSRSGRHYRPDAAPSSAPKVGLPAQPDVENAGPATAFVPRYEDGYRPVSRFPDVVGIVDNGSEGTGRHRRPER